jgi:hypothetical protein
MQLERTDMQLLRNLAVTIVLSLAATLPALADDGHKHSHDNDHHHEKAERTAQHGGVLAEVGHHELEIVADKGELAVYITGDHGTDEVVSKAKATAAVLTKGKKVDVELTPEAGAVLKGTGDFEAGPGTTIVLTLTMPDHEPEQVRVKIE